MLYLGKKKRNKVKVARPAPTPPPVVSKRPPSPTYLTNEQSKKVVEAIRKIQADPTNLHHFQVGIDNMLKPHIQDPLVRAKLAIKITSYAKVQL